MRKLSNILHKTLINEAFEDQMFARFFGKADNKMKEKFKASFLDKRNNAISNTEIKDTIKVAPNGFAYDRSLKAVTDYEFLPEFSSGFGTKFRDEVGYKDGSKKVRIGSFSSDVLIFANFNDQLIGFSISVSGKKDKVDGIVRGAKTPQDYLQYIQKNGGYICRTNLKEEVDTFVSSSDGLIDKDAYLKEKNKYLTPQKIILGAAELNAIRKGHATVGDLLKAVTAPARNTRIDYLGINKGLVIQLDDLQKQLLNALKTNTNLQRISRTVPHESLKNLKFQISGNKIYLNLNFERKEGQWSGYSLSGHIAIDLNNPKNIIGTRIENIKGLPVTGEYGSENGATIWGAYEISEFEHGSKTKNKFVGDLKKFILEFGKIPEVGKVQRVWNEYQNKINVDGFAKGSELTELGSEEAKDILKQIAEKVHSAMKFDEKNNIVSRTYNDGKNTWETSLIKTDKDYLKGVVLSRSSIYKLNQSGGTERAGRNGWPQKVWEFIEKEVPDELNKNIFGGLKVLTSYGSSIRLNNDIRIDQLL